MRARLRGSLIGALVCVLLIGACGGDSAHQGSAPPPAVQSAATSVPEGGGGAPTAQASASERAPDVTPTAAAAQPSAAEATPEPTPPGPPPPRRARELAPPVIGAQAAVVIDGDSGAVLYEKDAHTPRPPASTTKILTALLALERGNLDDVIEVHLDGRSYWGSVMGLVNGDRFTLRDLLYGLLLPSGNDAAYVIAVHLAGSEPAFAELMNQRMRELKLTDNVWVNASGLGRDNSNLVSAYDLAQLARVAMSNPEFAKLVGTRTWTARGSRVLSMSNGNPLLYAYPGSDGVKIGWGGRWAGNTIVGSAVRGGHRLFVVLLDTPDRTGESAGLFNWAFASYAWEGQ